MSANLNVLEAHLIADCLDGCGGLLDSDPSWLPIMIGEDGAIIDAAAIGCDAEGRVLLIGSRVGSGLEHEIYDGIRLRWLDEKWGVDGQVLLAKLRRMSRAQRETIIRTVARAREHGQDAAVFDCILAELEKR